MKFQPTPTAGETTDLDAMWTPVRLGRIELAHRLAMAPMTRRRAAADGSPTPLMTTYYGQRASFGMIITEGAYPSGEGRAYPHQPGMLEPHAAGWRQITEAVHRHGGRISLQLMHAGRLTHPGINGDREILAPSAIGYEPAAAHSVHQVSRNPVPRETTASDITRLVNDHATAARLAIAAGFDAVELHGANGYLLQQYLAPNTNQRNDSYGGSPLNRARFVIEVIEAVAAAIGGDRVGLRISPGANIQGTSENDPDDLLATYTALADGVRPLGLGYTSLIHADIDGPLVQHLRRAFATPLIANTGFGTITDRDEAGRILRNGVAEVVAVGRPAIANPDLAHRWKTGARESVPDPTTFYTGNAIGYIDYPGLHEEPPAVKP